MSKDDKSTYYDEGGIEVLEIIRAKLTREQWQGYLLGNALKYLCRANFKGDICRDLEKAKNYISWLSDCFEAEPRFLEEYGVPEEYIEPSQGDLAEAAEAYEPPMECHDPASVCRYQTEDLSGVYGLICNATRAVNLKCRGEAVG